MTTELTVRAVSKNRVLPYIMAKHYAKRCPIISYSYGLFKGNSLIGICTYGMPARSFNTLSCWKIIELNRLFLSENKSNQASFFISKTLKLLPKSILLVSYADVNWNHHGYIYQATNWMYSGKSLIKNKIYINNREMHRRSFCSKYGQFTKKKIEKLIQKGHNIIIKDQLSKHRYFYPIAKSKKERKQMIEWVQEHFGTYPYPKGKNQNYKIEEEKRKGFLK